MTPFDDICYKRAVAEAAQAHRQDQAECQMAEDAANRWHATLAKLRKARERVDALLLDELASQEDLRDAVVHLTSVVAEVEREAGL